MKTLQIETALEIHEFINNSQETVLNNIVVKNSNE